MQEKKVYPNHYVFVALLDTLSRFGHLEAILEVITNSNNQPKTTANSILIDEDLLGATFLGTHNTLTKCTEERLL